MTMTRKKSPPKKGPTVREAVRHAARRLSRAQLVYGHGTFSAAEEALFLVMETLRVPLKKWEKYPDRFLTAREDAAISALVGLRIESRRPAAYLVQKMYLEGLPFYVDERVIVPRSFIAGIIAQEDFPLAQNPKTILDLCTGSGCLAVLAAHVFPDAKIDAAELSLDAAAVAALNIKDSGCADRITLRTGDLFAAVKRKTYDLILTNPPYVTPASMKRLPAEYKHEPDMALAGGGRDGMDIVRRILEEAPRHLNPGGGILCEIGAGKKALEKSFPALPFLWLDTENSTDEVFWLSREDF
jgi:ribosomal protein L3 glutamine methyltransferase